LGVRVHVSDEPATVEDTDELPGSVNGDCSHDLHRIRVRTSNSPLQRVKTLAHELGHTLLHEEYDSRPLAELEAESVAFIVCDNLGLTTDDYSFGYVATWAGGGDEAQKEIKASGGRIQRAADQILSTVEASNASLAA
jgi:antirestriction protein ArdC